MIQPIVEGAGEVEAVPLLLRRLNAEFGVAHALIGRPIRQKREQLMKREGMERAIELARRQAGCQAVFILLDADYLCPRTEAPPLQTQAHELARQFPCPLVLANREYEAWFLASQEDLGARQPYPSDPDQKRGAKEELERQLDIYYNERADQPKFTARLNFERTYQRSRSFRKLVKDYHGLLQTLGHKPKPNPWEEGHN